MNTIYLAYLFKNIQHYFVRYITVFGLMLVMSFLLSVALFLYSGISSAARQSARIAGDVVISVRYDARDADHEELTSAQKQQFSQEWEELTRRGWSAFEVREAVNIPATLVSAGQSREGTVAAFEAVRSQVSVDLVEGREPHSAAEVLLPASFRSQTKPGDGITLIYKNSDKIINSEVLSVCGFFVEKDELRGRFLVSQAELSVLDPQRLPDTFHVYLTPQKAAGTVMSKSAKEAFSAQARQVSLRYFHDDLFAQRNVTVRTSYDEYAQSQSVIDLFLMILVVFIVALSIVAVFSIINVNYMTVLERIRVIGTLFSFGLQKAHGALLLASEIAVLSLIGSVLGILLGAVAATLIGTLPLVSDSKTMTALLAGERFLRVAFPPEAFVATVAVCTLFPFVVSLLSVLKLARGPVVNQLYTTH